MIDEQGLLNDELKRPGRGRHQSAMLVRRSGSPRQGRQADHVDVGLLSVFATLRDILTS